MNVVRDRDFKAGGRDKKNPEKFPERTAGQCLKKKTLEGFLKITEHLIDSQKELLKDSYTKFQDDFLYEILENS